jgi:RNA recognition motif-containing protein
MNIFVTKLSRNTTSEDLVRLFEAFGEVRSAKVIIDRATGTSKGYGFIEMGTEEAAAYAISTLNETMFQDATIIVKPANPREERPQVRRVIVKKPNNATEESVEPSLPEDSEQMSVEMNPEVDEEAE